MIGSFAQSESNASARESMIVEDDIFFGWKGLEGLGRAWKAERLGVERVY